MITTSDKSSDSQVFIIVKYFVTYHCGIDNVLCVGDVHGLCDNILPGNSLEFLYSPCHWYS